MHIEMSPPGRGLKRYRVVGQDGYIYHDKLVDAIDDAFALSYPGSRVVLPDGTALSPRIWKRDRHKYEGREMKRVAPII